MSKLVKTAITLAALMSLGACTVVPPRVAYTPPAVVIGAPPAPYYGGYYGGPAYMPPPPRYYGYRHW